MGILESDDDFRSGATFTQMKEFSCRLQTVEDMLRAIHSVVVTRTVHEVLEGGAATGQSTLPARLPVHLQHIDAYVRELVTIRLEGTDIAKAAQTDPVGILESDDDFRSRAIFTQMKELSCRLQTVEDMLRAILSVVS